jgi:hypothetical protein
VGLNCEHRLLCERRFGIFHYPVPDDEAPDYRNVVHNPMDVATLLQRVDSGHYLTKKSFLADVDFIPANAQVGDIVGGNVVGCHLEHVELEVLGFGFVGDGGHGGRFPRSEG